MTTVEHEVGLNSFIAGPSRATTRAAYTQVELKSLKFVVGLDLISEHHAFPETTETVRMTLPAGLSWAGTPAWPRTLWPAGRPGPWSFEPTSQSCETAGQVVTCQTSGVPAATTLFGWIFDVVAAKSGIYKVVGEVVPPTDGVNRPPRGVSTPTKVVLTLVVGARTGAAKTSTVTLTRPMPSFVRATVEVTQAGAAVRATSPSCVGSFVGDPSYQRRRSPADASLGRVICTLVFNNAKYAGKTLAAELTFTVGRTKVKRSFSVRVGPGTVLSSPKGATIGR